MKEWKLCELQQVTISQWGSGDPYAFLGTFFETFRITYVYIKEFKTT